MGRGKTANASTTSGNRLFCVSSYTLYISSLGTQSSTMPARDLSASGVSVLPPATKQSGPLPAVPSPSPPSHAGRRRRVWCRRRSRVHSQCRADSAASGWLLPTTNVTARVAGPANFGSPIFPVQFASATSPTGPAALVDWLGRMGAIIAGYDESIVGAVCRESDPCPVAELSAGHCFWGWPGYSTVVPEIALLAIVSEVWESPRLPSHMPTQEDFRPPGLIANRHRLG